MERITGAITAAWEYLDPKLKYTILTGIVAWAITKYAIDLNTDVSALVTGVIAAITGYEVPNDASELREIAAEDDPPDVPDVFEDVDAAADEDTLAGVTPSELT
jgi:hypothetical protein